MHTVVLVGTDHKFQRPLNGPTIDEAGQFRAMIQYLCLQHSLAGIAEEMSLRALEENNCTESVAQQECALLGLHHQFSDPPREERYKLGIRQDNDIRAEHMVDGWTPEQIEADVLARGSVPSDRIRELIWLQKIQELNVWPLLFICGANHFTQFVALLKANRISVVEAHPDWEPTPKPSPL